MRKSSGYGGEERYGKGREEYGTSYGRGKGSEYGGSYKMNGYKKGGSYGKKNSYSVAKAHRYNGVNYKLSI
jgi:hypothetical protein